MRTRHFGSSPVVTRSPTAKNTVPPNFRDRMSDEHSDDSAARSPNFARDIFAIALVAFTLLLTVSMVTRDVADPVEAPIWPLRTLYTPDAIAYPQNESITNACGYWGALLASALFDGLGLAAALIVGGLGGVSTALLIRGHMNAPVLRTLGGSVVVLGAATAANLLPVQLEGMPVVGNGGYLGAMMSGWLQSHFAPAGTWILTLTVLSVGLLMTTDYALLYAGRMLMAGGAKVSRGGIERAAKVLPRRRRNPFTDLEEPIQLEGEADAAEGDGAEDDDEEFTFSEPKIKFRNSKRKEEPEANALLDADALDEEEEYAHDESEAYENDEAYDDDEEEELEDDEPVTRELEVEDETLALRNDDEHDVPAPRVRVKKRKKKPEDEEREALYASMRESSEFDPADYRLPRVEMLEASDDISYDEQLVEVRRKAKILERTFKDFGFNIRVVEIETGPVIAQYEIELEAGLRLEQDHGLGRRFGHCTARPQRSYRRTDSRKKYGRYRSSQ